VRRIRSRREKAQPTDLSNMVAEELAAWIVAFLVLGAGLSLLAFHERSVRDGVVATGWRTLPVAGNDEWDDPECRRTVMSCADLAAAGNSADPLHAPSWVGIGW
jgi:hypothetical protein